MQLEESDFINKKIPSSRKTVGVLPSDLKRLKALREPKEKIYMTVNRILNIVEEKANA